MTSKKVAWLSGLCLLFPAVVDVAANFNRDTGFTDDDIYRIDYVG